MRGLFVTGTDTGVGKTVLSALLLAELRRRTINAAPIKPVQTGCSQAEAGGREQGAKSGSVTPQSSCFTVPDLDYSLAMAGMSVSGDDYKNMAPYTYEPACSPHLAGEIAGREIDIAEMVIAARTLASEYDFIIAEGAGGIMVPLTRRETTLDLMQALKFPVLIAARPGLGTINHTLLSIRALRDDDLEIAGVVFLAGEDVDPGFIEEDNALTIEQFGRIPALGTIPYCSALNGNHPSYSDLPIPVVAEVEKIVNRLGIQ